MEPEIPVQPEQAPLPSETATALAPQPLAVNADAQEFAVIRKIFVGDQGLRAGWSIAIFGVLLVIFGAAFGFAFYLLHLVGNGKKAAFSATGMFWNELIVVLTLLCAASVVALIERRGSLLAFNLRGPRRLQHFLAGLVFGFAALSTLVGAMTAGHWLIFGPAALTGTEIYRLGAMWGAAFLLVGCSEEGLCRCYLQFTLTRGLNFWWALGLVTLMCVSLVLTQKGLGVWGVYLMALLGLLPCLRLHLKKAESSGFWQAAWVTSTFFGFMHTGNSGENWIGIFAAAAIGFVFVVSIRVTGSAWWAIGCHAAWDWAETYFYGAIDSGNVATGHFLTTNPAGNVLWSGGTDGPEGSVLVLPVILLILLALLAVYGRKKPPVVNNAQALEQVAN